MKYYLSILMLSIFALVGCASDNKELYYWGDYQGNIYKTLKGTETDPKAQIIALEKILTVANSKDKQVPPGLYANLGLLYIQDGKFTEARDYFEKERTLYPESANFIQFLSDNMDGKRKK
ncbi:DUF4810 domain-containing protein [Orbaceae bacterium ESL0721]|nr:DUF4810 domain-containing protein [Orbaceae bacterium ESL0721]